LALDFTNINFKNLVSDDLLSNLRNSIGDNPPSNKTPNDRTNPRNSHSDAISFNKLSSTRVVEETNDRKRVYQTLEKGSELHKFMGRPVILPEPYSGKSTITFPTDGDQLDNTDRTSLAPIIEFLVKNPDTNISVEGHTDTQGSQAYNQDLSERRANNTHKHLLTELKAAGISNPEERIRIHSFGTGEENLLVPTKDNIEMESNRSVEVHFHYNEKAVNQARHTEHILEVNENSARDVVVSPSLSNTFKKQLETQNPHYAIVNGTATLAISDDITKTVRIDYQQVDQETLQNIRFTLKNDKDFHRGTFVSDFDNNQIHAEVLGQDGKIHRLATIQVPEGQDLNNIELGLLNKSGKIEEMALDQKHYPTNEVKELFNSIGAAPEVSNTDAFSKAPAATTGESITTTLERF